MKPILVPTDFSPQADNAVQYALHMAKYMKSNMVLCHAFITLMDVTVAGQMVWPLYDYDTLKEESNSRLEQQARALMQDGTLLNTPNTFKPVVEYLAEATTALQLVIDMAAKEKAGLAVVGLSGSGSVTKFFAGSTSRDLIEEGVLPVLLIPSGCNFKPIHKIAFATDLNSSDIGTICSIAVFAKCFGAELVVVHVERNPTAHDSKKASDFLNEITCKANYDKIYYREFKNDNVNDGLQWLSEHGWIDMLVMVHRKESMINRLLKGSLTKRQAESIHIPLLVLPDRGQGFLI